MDYGYLGTRILIGTSIKKVEEYGMAQYGLAMGTGGNQNNGW